MRKHTYNLGQLPVEVVDEVPHVLLGCAKEGRVNFEPFLDKMVGSLGCFQHVILESALHGLRWPHQDVIGVANSKVEPLVYKGMANRIRVCPCGCAFPQSDVFT